MLYNWKQILFRKEWGGKAPRCPYPFTLFNFLSKFLFFANIALKLCNFMYQKVPVTDLKFPFLFSYYPIVMYFCQLTIIIRMPIFCIYILTGSLFLHYFSKMNTFIYLTPLTHQHISSTCKRQGLFVLRTWLLT